VFVVDTNVLLYAADRHCPEHARCRELLETWRYDPLPWYLSWNIVYEFLRVSTHLQVFRMPWSVSEGWQFVEALFASPGLRVLTATPRHAEIAAQTLVEMPHLYGNLLHKGHTAILMREHGIRRIYTRDGDFHKFAFLEAIDPMAPGRPKSR
jgi:toxin-antitoxin system PIN domain toxin